MPWPCNKRLFSPVLHAVPLTYRPEERAISHARHRKTLSRGRARILAVALVVASTTLAAPLTVRQPASADTSTPDGWTQEQIDARYQQYRERINQLMAEGKTQLEVDLAVSQEFDIVRIGLSKLGLAGKSADDADGPTSAASLTMYTPTFSYDNYLHKYVMAASWEWKQCAQYDRPCWTSDGGVGPMGGGDGMALKINQAIYRYNAGISTSDNCGTPVINNNQADTDTGHGIAFIEQDTVRYSSSNGACLGTPYRYDWHRGTVSETFTFQNACDSSTTVQVDSKIGHTWVSTAVDSISISGSASGSASISFSWSDTEHRWNAIPAAPAYGNC